MAPERGIDRDAAARATPREARVRRLGRERGRVGSDAGRWAPQPWLLTAYDSTFSVRGVFPTWRAARRLPAIRLSRGMGLRLRTQASCSGRCGCATGRDTHLNCRSDVRPQPLRIHLGERFEAIRQGFRLSLTASWMRTSSRTRTRTSRGAGQGPRRARGRDHPRAEVDTEAPCATRRGDLPYGRVTVVLREPCAHPVAAERGTRSA